MRLEIELPCHPSRWSPDLGLKKLVEQGGKCSHGGNPSCLQSPLGSSRKWEENREQTRGEKDGGICGAYSSTTLLSQQPADPVALKAFQPLRSDVFTFSSIVS